MDIGSSNTPHSDNFSQLELFSDEDDMLVRVCPSAPLEGNKRCIECQHILGVHFHHGNLYFCSIDKRYGGHYGKKIKKSQSICPRFKQAEDETLSIIDGYYGGEYKAMKR